MTDELKFIKKSVNKIEIFRPKRKFNAPVSPDFYLGKNDKAEVEVCGIKMILKNTKDQNVYVRFK